MILVCISGFDIIILTGSPAQPESAAALNAIKITRASFRVMASSSVEFRFRGVCRPVEAYRATRRGTRGSADRLRITRFDRRARPRIGGARPDPNPERPLIRLQNI